ncbi:FAD-dependent oxidoreductase [Roseofilum sp. BLCC_M154]|uniref:FAD-dependent oxidoreductase n=1 Tax=Roseofilum acuticapitatum BLCC-M154 TaxID=3022444 RepID=A0ABT7AWH7_9CYAN|nr:FAD-dependent oxidoreductase [Roseofilum acuticapitatum]MDJ1170932.1 FAD-dependent oxidoreductase [Roseofilum acuticapitatum BLCC-M154]
MNHIQIEERTAEILVVGGGTGGTCAAIQAARRGAQTLLVSEFPWLGGMLTAAGVSAPDGSELAAFQTGMWGAFVRELGQKQPGGLDHNWVSLFGFSPQIGAQIFQDWVDALPNLDWIWGQKPLEVYRKGNRVTGVRFQNLRVNATLTLDGTELGDLLALADIPHRWGWELQGEWGEPSAPKEANELTERYPVQAPTWVIHLQDYGEGINAPEIPGSVDESAFAGAWENHGVEKFLSYGRLPGGTMMINWPIKGNDYGVNLNRLIESPQNHFILLQEALEHSLNFGRTIQSQLGQRYGLAVNQFPVLDSTTSPRSALLPQFQQGVALYPYFRESRRLKGKVTLTEQDILPQSEGNVAQLPRDKTGKINSIVIGNYPNDHHYPEVSFSLAPKAVCWGGRWTGTPFTIPYGCLVPEEITGFLVCEKNISVSHLANGATRLQPVVMNIGQAAGMAAALCIQRQEDPQDLPVQVLQSALLTDISAPAAVIPCFNLTHGSPDWQKWQFHYLDDGEEYPKNGNAPLSLADLGKTCTDGLEVSGLFKRLEEQSYQLQVNSPDEWGGSSWRLITTEPLVNEALQNLDNQKLIRLWGRMNLAGGWIVVEEITDVFS